MSYITDIEVFAPATAEQLHMYAEQVFKEFLALSEEAKLLVRQALAKPSHNPENKILRGSLRFEPLGTVSTKLLSANTLGDYERGIYMICAFGEYYGDDIAFVNALGAFMMYFFATSELANDKNIEELTRRYRYHERGYCSKLQKPDTDEPSQEVRERYSQWRRFYIRMSGVQQPSPIIQQQVILPPGFSVMPAALPAKNSNSSQPSAYEISEAILKRRAEEQSSEPQRTVHEQRTSEMIHREEEANAVLKKKLAGVFHASESGTKENKTHRRW